MQLPLYSLGYTVDIHGVSNNELLNAMQEASSTYSLSKKGIDSVHALKLRAETDAERLKNTACYFGYFDTTVQTSVSEDLNPHVLFDISLGPQYTFSHLAVTWADKDLVIAQLEHQKKDPTLAKGPTVEDAPSFVPGKPALGTNILAIQKEICGALRERGFAFARIVSHNVIADKAFSHIDINLDIQTGPIVWFGDTTIIGASTVHPEFFTQATSWKQDEVYKQSLLQQTESELQQSGLFQSVQVTESDVLGDDWTLPVTVLVSEAKRRTIGAGVSYTTTIGAGITAEWEHRNIYGLGRTLSTYLAIWQRQRSARISYTIPNFVTHNQSLSLIGEYDQQSYLPFTSSAITLSAPIGRPLNSKTRIQMGPSWQLLESQGIIGHKIYHLAKLPGQLQWSSATPIADPTTGATFNLHLTPAYQYVAPSFSYLIHTSSFSMYFSDESNICTLATKLSIGNVAGASKNTIPLPDRFFGGSQNALRGYKTGTVSPLNQHHQPIGGRSIGTLSLEARTRFRNNFGWVVFYDVGNVFRDPIPIWSKISFLQSIGMGVRYATPIGPLRVDIGVPLQRRRHIDPPFQIYFSIGQAF
jgi:translocation and assembly module TamA